MPAGLGEFAGRFDAGEATADDDDRRVRRRLGQPPGEVPGRLPFAEGIGEPIGAGHCRRNRCGAADGVDEVVVSQGLARSQVHLMRVGVDPFGGVDDQPDCLGEHRGEFIGGRVVSDDELMQPDALDEHRPRIDQRDVDIAALAEAVGGEHAGVTAADHDDAGRGHSVSSGGGASLTLAPSPSGGTLENP